MSPIHLSQRHRHQMHRYRHRILSQLSLTVAISVSIQVLSHRGWDQLWRFVEEVRLRGRGERWEIVD